MRRVGRSRRTISSVWTITSRIRAGCARAIASRSDTCVETCVTMARSDASISVEDVRPHSSATYSVWPVNVGALKRVAALLIGSVTMAAASPASASFVARAT